MGFVARYECPTCGYVSKNLSTGRMMRSSLGGYAVFTCGACKDLFSADCGTAELLGLLKTAPKELLPECPTCHSAESVAPQKSSNAREAWRNMHEMRYECPACGRLDCRSAMVALCD